MPASSSPESIRESSGECRSRRTPAPFPSSPDGSPTSPRRGSSSSSAWGSSSSPPQGQKGGGRIFKHLALRGVILIVAQHLIENLAWLLGQMTKIGAEEAIIPGTNTNVWLHFGVLN